MVQRNCCRIDSIVQCRSSVCLDGLNWGPEFNSHILQARLSVLRKLSTKFYQLKNAAAAIYELKTPPQGRKGPCWIAELTVLPRGSLSIFLGKLKCFFGGSLSIFWGELKYFLGV